LEIVDVGMLRCPWWYCCGRLGEKRVHKTRSMYYITCLLDDKMMEKQTWLFEHVEFQKGMIYGSARILFGCKDNMKKVIEWTWNSLK